VRARCGVVSTGVNGKGAGYVWEWGRHALVRGGEEHNCAVFFRRGAPAAAGATAAAAAAVLLLSSFFFRAVAAVGRVEVDEPVDAIEQLRDDAAIHAPLRPVPLARDHVQAVDEQHGRTVLRRQLTDTCGWCAIDRVWKRG